MTVADILNSILESEGEEYTNDPDDRGGPTKWGVTLPVLSEFWGCPVTVEQLKALSRDEAYEIFEHLYANRSGFLKLSDEAVRAMMVDWAVNGGVETAVKHLQFALAVPVDGICGPVTLAAANGRDPRELLKLLGAQRQEWYVELVKSRPSQIKWLGGWLNRNWKMAVEPL